MKKNLLAATLFILAAPTFAAEVTISCYGDIAGLIIRNNMINTVYVDAKKVIDNKSCSYRAPCKIDVPAGKHEFILCLGSSFNCDTIEFAVQDGKPNDIGTLMISPGGGTTYKTLTGTALRIFKERLAEQDRKEQEIEEAKNSAPNP